MTTNEYAYGLVDEDELEEEGTELSGLGDEKEDEEEEEEIVV